MDQPKAANVTLGGAPAAPALAPTAAAAPQTPSAGIIAAAAALEQVTVTDARGRKLTLARLGPLKKTRLLRLMGPDDARNMPLVGYYSMAASVIAVDGEPYPFPVKSIHVDALLDRLGDDGLEAIGKGWKDAGWVPPGDDDEVLEGDPAKIKN